jgi:hypothetical protein
MRRAAVLRAVSALLIIGIAGCKGGMRGPEVAHPMTGTTRYLCCNLYYEKTKTNDTNYQVGTKVPFGTKVFVDRVRRDSVDFTPEGQPTITLIYKQGDRNVPFDSYLDRLFVDRDPRGQLRKVKRERVEAIERGTIEKGMTREQVMMARGIPPAPHAGPRPPTLDILAEPVGHARRVLSSATRWIASRGSTMSDVTLSPDVLVIGGGRRAPSPRPCSRTPASARSSSSASAFRATTSASRCSPRRCRSSTRSAPRTRSSGTASSGSPAARSSGAGRQSRGASSSARTRAGGHTGIRWCAPSSTSSS